MDNEFINRLKDYFEPSELAELLDGDIKMEDFVSAFEDVIEENRDMLEDYMLYGR